MNQVIITRSSSTVRGVGGFFTSRAMIGQNTLVLILIILTSIMSLMYLVHENESATKGYSIRALDYEYQELLQRNEVWNMRIASARALNTIKNSELVGTMTSQGNVEYVVYQPESAR